MNLCAKRRPRHEEKKAGFSKITLLAVALDGEFIKPYPYLSPGKYHLLSVGDTGCGMSREIMDRIFEPFSRQKNQGKEQAWGCPWPRALSWPMEA
jgi:signal transduction histidine kinase